MTRSIDLGGRDMFVPEDAHVQLSSRLASVALYEIVGGEMCRIVPFDGEDGTPAAALLAQKKEHQLRLESAFIIFTMFSPGTVHQTARHQRMGLSMVLNGNPREVVDRYKGHVSRLESSEVAINEAELERIDIEGSRLVTALATIGCGNGSFDAIIIPTAWDGMDPPEEAPVADYPTVLAASLLAAGRRTFERQYLQ